MGNITGYILTVLSVVLCLALWVSIIITWEEVSEIVDVPPKSIV